MLAAHDCQIASHSIVLYTCCPLSDAFNVVLILVSFPCENTVLQRRHPHSSPQRRPLWPTCSSLACGLSAHLEAAAVCWHTCSFSSVKEADGLWEGSWSDIDSIENLRPLGNPVYRKSLQDGWGRLQNWYWSDPAAVEGYTDGQYRGNLSSYEGS